MDIDIDTAAPSTGSGAPRRGRQMAGLWGILAAYLAAGFLLTLGAVHLAAGFLTPFAFLAVVLVLGAAAVSGLPPLCIAAAGSLSRQANLVRWQRVQAGYVATAITVQAAVWLTCVHGDSESTSKVLPMFAAGVVVGVIPVALLLVAGIRNRRR